LFSYPVTVLTGNGPDRKESGLVIPGLDV